MRLATWNVNSVTVRAPLVRDWLLRSGVDALALQETKVSDEAFPREIFAEIGYDALVHGQKTYNGVALLLRRDGLTEVSDTRLGLPGYPDEQKRFIAARLTGRDGVTVLFAGIYAPNGQAPGLDKYLYKLDWFSALTRWARSELAAGAPLIIAGDFNIAPRDEDVWDISRWRDGILVSAPERAALSRLLAAGLSDAWTLAPGTGGRYTWWDYRQSAFEQDQGLRIDLVLTAAALAPRLASVSVDRAPRALERPSDHAPVTLELRP